MAYSDNLNKKLITLLCDPQKYYKKVWPFVMSRCEFYKRKWYERIGIERFSKPYPGHDSLLRHIRNLDGFFIQCGGNDGYFQDPTYYLEKFRGWSGLIIEPLSVAILCRKNRSRSFVRQIAVVSTDYKDTTADFIDCNAMSFINGTLENGEEWITAGEKTQQIKAEHITVPVDTLQNIIDDYFKINPRKRIDLLVLDIEGYEFEALRGLDFTINKPEYILFEAHTEERKHSIHMLLKSHGYCEIAEPVSRDFLYTIADQL